MRRVASLEILGKYCVGLVINTEGVWCLGAGGVEGGGLTLEGEMV